MINLLICVFRPFHRNNTALCCRVYSTGKTLLGAKVSIINAPAEDSSGVIYVVNHQDSLDVCLLGGAMPRNTVLLGKKDLLFIPIFGLVYWLAGNILIDRGNRSKARETMAGTARRIKEKNCSVWIFPEGTRSRGKGLLPFKTGAFHLAIESGLPIVPICMSSTHRNIHPGHWRSGEAIIEFLEPLPSTGLVAADARAFADKVQQQMTDHIAMLDKRIAG
ncbi:MAG: 1-acylglycerol-3-phosphate O-acyltransferase [Oleibacter sp.]|nr:1-acylglycerol-3-phosphate O-acyltransferase [Thalassolituus sp.]